MVELKSKKIKLGMFRHKISILECKDKLFVVGGI